MQPNIKLLTSEILKGYSVLKIEENEKIYTKHFTPTDNAEIDFTYQHYYNLAISKNLPTKQQKIDYLIEQKEWSLEREKEIEEINFILNNLRETLSTKSFLESHRIALNEQIKVHEEKLIKINEERNNLIGFSAEDYASKITNDLYIYYSFFKDPLLEEKYFDEEHFNNIDRDILYNLTKTYSNYFESFNSSNFKKVALAPHFLNLFYLCNDDPYVFFGKPVLHLTFFQSEVFGLARYFKNLISDCKTKPPSDVLSDPEKLIAWSEATNNAEKVIKNDTKEGQSAVLFGSSKEDLKRLGYDDGGVDLAKKANEKGGELNMMDVMQLMGS